MTLRIGSLCSGYGGLEMAVQAVLGGELAWVADPDPGAAAILKHHHPDVPNLGDITKTRWEDVTRVDVLCTGYPCQPFSDAGLRLGVEDERHIWPYIATALRVLRPRYTLFENVAGHLGRGFDVVLSDLAALGFDAEWRTVRASDVGAPHRRERLFILATAGDPQDILGPRPDACGRGGAPAADAGGTGLEVGAVEHHGPERQAVERGRGELGSTVIDWGVYEPAIRRWEHIFGRPAPRPTEPGRTGERLSPAFVEWMMGLPAGHVTAVPGLSRNAQLRLLGNGVVPQQGAAAIAHLLERRAAA